MHFARPQMVRYQPAQRHMAMAHRRFVAGLSGMGDLGDDLVGMAALPDLLTKLKGFIINKAGTQMAAAVANNQSLPAIIYSAADTYTKGNAGSLFAEAQQAWNAWKAQAEPAESPSNIYWVLARCIARWSNELIQAANAQIASGLLTDAVASKASYTLVDTTQQGTTWYGGTTVTSKLTNGQWASVLDVAFNTIARGISQGVLPFTYLDVLIKAVCADPTLRRFPVWTPPYAGLVAGDPRGTAFRTMIKQLGWGSATSLWFSYTQQAWVSQNAAEEAQDKTLSAAITALNFTSGKVLLDQLGAKVADYFAARGEAVAAIQQFKQMATGPLKAKIPPGDLQAMQTLEKQFASTDTTVFNTLNPAGLWPSDTKAGMSFLGISQFVIGGVALVASMGMIVWAIGLMTATSRSAAAQTKATADNILATVDEVKASCIRAYQASAKTPADEKAYQDCLLATKSLTDSIPKPPEGSDPLGLKWIAIIGVVGIGGFVAWQKFGKK
jgi:hypothetical protein